MSHSYPLKPRARSNVSEDIHITDTTDADSCGAGALIVDGGVSISKKLRVCDTTESSSTTTGSIVTYGGVGIGKALNIGGAVTINSTTQSNGSNSGALIVSGGVGIAKDLNVNGNMYISVNSYQFGTTNLYGTTLNGSAKGTSTINMNMELGNAVSSAGIAYRVIDQIVFLSFPGYTSAVNAYPTATPSTYIQGNTNLPSALFPSIGCDALIPLMAYNGTYTVGLIKFATNGDFTIRVATFVTAFSILSNIGWEPFMVTYPATF